MTVTSRKRLSKVEEFTEQMFQLDALYESLTSGRLCGQKFSDETTQLLLVLLERLDWTPDARQLAGSLPHYPEKFDLNAFRSTLAVLGFVSTETRLAGEQLGRCTPGTLVFDDVSGLWLLKQKDRHLQLVRPDDEGESTRRIERKKTYRVAQFEPAGEDLHHGLGIGSQSWVADTIGRFVPELRLLLLLTFLSGCTAILIAFGITTIFDTVIPTRNYATLTGIIVGLALVFGFDFAFRSIRANVVGRVSGRLEYILGSALLGKILRLPNAMLAGVSLGDQLARLRQFESIRDLFGGPVVLLLLELPLALFLLCAVALIAWPLAGLLAVYVVVFFICAVLLAPAIRRETQKQGVAQSNLNRVTLEVLEQRHQIGREGLAEYWINIVDSKVRDLARARRRVAALSRWLEAMSQASLPFAAASTIGFGAVLVMQGTMTGGALVATTILTWRLFAPVQQGLLILPKLQSVLQLFRQIDALMRIPEEDGGSETALRGTITGNLVAQGISLRHPKSIAPALIGVQFEIPHGSFVTISGRSGSGKTTLLKVLSGQLAPQSGAVLFNDLNLTQMSRSFRARNIAFVPQNPLFIFGSVAQNLRLSDPSADDTKIEAILSELGLDNWLRDLPEGMDTRLDPSVYGALLSASVRTSLAVAQALLNDPVVLLLDEPSGNMDAELEEKLIQALERRRGRMTTVVVTHRPSLVRRSDHVVFLNGGQAIMRSTAELEARAS